MKRFLFSLILLIMCHLACSQVIVYRYPYHTYPVTVYKVRTYPVYKYVYKEKENTSTPGYVDLRIHCDYNFNNALRTAYNSNIEFGGSLSYYFKSKSKTSFGILAGYDHGLNQWWRYPSSTSYFIYETNYWDIRAGACLSRYFSIGMTFGEYRYNDTYMADIGCFANVNLPLCDNFGIFADGKWTQYQGFSVGVGIFFYIYTE